MQVIIADRPRTLDEWVARLAGASTVPRKPSESPPPAAPGKRQAGAATGGLRKILFVGSGAIAAVAIAAVAWNYWFIEPSEEQDDAPGEGGSAQASLDVPASRNGSEVSSATGGDAILVVDTQPPGAEVWLNDGVVGTTPFERRDIREGTYTVTLRHPHYQTVRLRAKRFTNGEVLRIAETLIPGVGKLTVLTEPRNAWIERDGERVAQGTPVTLEDLPAGLVDLTLGADEHRSMEVQVEVPNDGVGRLERTLERIPYGTLTLDLVPVNAQVTLLDVAPAYRPGVRLPEGEHRVVVSRTGYRSLTRTIAVSGETRARIALEAIPMRPGDAFQDRLTSGGKAPEMVVIPAGSFRMGCVSGLDCESDEKPVHTVTIPQPFAVSKYEVTFSNWEACVSGGGCKGYRPTDRDWGRGRRPVINVSWNDAKEYVDWLSSQTGQPYRLLTEAEWEYAARAGATTKYSWGNDIGRSRANCDGCGSPWDDSQTAPVGSFGANAFGLHDMHGNVLEWVEDCWNGSYSGAPSNGSAWLRGNCERRVLRGGSWYNLPR
ncbi:MAG: SUMF1/EgtB/PvdO family nonheme iron enzyme, partial [Candidatus Tectomicrobia bacterium]|nr:SUMF1/EgtB/PvdO family nonheme iron enzyme [Candidatus Tectomicrobia bacterium]